MKKWMNMTGLLAALCFVVAPVMAQKALDKAAGSVNKAADKVKSETTSAKEKVDKAQQDSKEKGKGKGCNCAQETKASFQQCLAGTKQLKNKARSEAINKCTEARKTSIQTCQQACKKSGNAGDAAQCNADCNVGKDEAVAICKAAFSSEDCKKQDANCLTEVQTSQNSCIANSEATNTQCLAGCK